jgi:putative flavoprotein involved in K+ transport
MDTEVLVVGAGPAGLATAACLRRRGIDPLVVDSGGAVGDSWRGRYDRLHLHTPRIQSGLPGRRIPRAAGRWVSRDDYARYLEDYAAQAGVRPRFGVRVARLDRDAVGWLATADRGPLRARQVVVATGYNGEPLMPAWPGADTFAGELRHAGGYTNAEPYRGRRVLVVGAGNTGAEIAADLAESGAAQVWLSVRTPPNVIPRSLGPVPTTLLGISLDFSPALLADPVNRLLQRRFVGDLTPTGLPVSRQGVVAQARATGTTPTIDVGLVAALRAGLVHPVAAVVRFDGAEVVLADGSRLAPDAVVAATGYSRGLAPVVGHLGVLDDRGRPLVRGRATVPGVPALRFVGISNPLKGLLFQIGLDARAAARAVTRELRRHPGAVAAVPPSGAPGGAAG